MQLIDENRFRELVEIGGIKHEKCEFIDSFKIAIQIDNVVIQAPDHIDMSANMDGKGWKKTDITTEGLQPGGFYLGISLQKLSLAANILGLMHTRSTISRLGLDVLRGSQYVSPGFGITELTPLVLELSPKISLKLPPLPSVAGLLLFELDKENIKLKTDHHKRFPFNFM